MKYITTADESRSLDREAMTSYGFPEAVLMENAGRDVVSLLRPEIDWKGKSVVVVCGTGNNGGDGFVIARYLCALSASVAVLLCGNEAHMSETARLYRRIIEKMWVQVIPVSEDTDWETPLESADVIVDALIGTGLSREVTGVKAEVIEMMNASRASVVSVDVPSGLSSERESLWDLPSWQITRWRWSRTSAVMCFLPATSTAARCSIVRSASLRLWAAFFP